MIAKPSRNTPKESKTIPQYFRSGPEEIHKYSNAMPRFQNTPRNDTNKYQNDPTKSFQHCPKTVSQYKTLSECLRNFPVTIPEGSTPLTRVSTKKRFRTDTKRFPTDPASLLSIQKCCHSHVGFYGMRIIFRLSAMPKSSVITLL